MEDENHYPDNGMDHQTPQQPIIPNGPRMNLPPLALTESWPRGKSTLKCMPGLGHQYIISTLYQCTGAYHSAAGMSTGSSESSGISASYPSK